MSTEHQAATSLALAPTLAPLLDGDIAPRQAFDRLRALGFRWIQLSATQAGFRPRDLDRSARRDVLATLRRHELAPAGIDLWIPSADFDDAQKADRAMSAVVNTINLAVDLRGGPGGQPLPISLILPANANAVKTIVERAGHYGVAIAAHNAPPVDIDSIGIGIDPAAWIIDGKRPDQTVASLGGRIVSARLCDVLPTGLRGPLSDRDRGKLDALAYKVALSVAGYRRPVVVDARQWLEPWPGIESTRDVWSRL